MSCKYDMMYFESKVKYSNNNFLYHSHVEKKSSKSRECRQKMVSSFWSQCTKADDIILGSKYVN